VRLTDFWERMDEVLGPGYSHSWARDVVLSPLGFTAAEAIERGTDTKEIWRAVCTVVEVPPRLR
jgi:hypothetical protein